MSRFLKTIQQSYNVLLEQDAPPDVAPDAAGQIQPDAAYPQQPPATPGDVDAQGETETTRKDSDKIVMVNIINKLLNLSISSISSVINAADYTADQKELAKESAEDQVSKLKNLVDTINQPDKKLNDIINLVNNTVGGFD